MCARYMRAKHMPTTTDPCLRTSADLCDHEQLRSSCGSHSSDQSDVHPSGPDQSERDSPQALMQGVWRDALADMDAEVLEGSRGSGRVDGCTALASVRFGTALSIAHAGK